MCFTFPKFCLLFFLSLFSLYIGIQITSVLQWLDWMIGCWFRSIRNGHQCDIYSETLLVPISEELVMALCKLSRCDVSPGGHYWDYNLGTLSFISSYSQQLHYSDVMTGEMASQITSLRIFYSTVYSGADQRKHQSSASLAFVRGIHRWPVNSPHKWPVTGKMFPFDDVIMKL